MQHPLLKTFALRGLNLKNRVVLAPLTRCRGSADKKRLATKEMVDHYTQRASAGLLITEATAISPQGYGFSDRVPGIHNQEQCESWKKVTTAVHEKNCSIFLQLWHMGRASHSSFQVDGQLPVSASNIKIENEETHIASGGKAPYEAPRALTLEEIPLVVADYVNAARLAIEAGFDGVEIHGANGYLIDQFLQVGSNQRTDDYGGSVEKRFRFMREVVEGVLKVLPAEKVGIRLSPNGAYNGMGSPDYREQFTYAFKELSKYDLMYIHVLDGLTFGFHKLGEPMTLKEIHGIITEVQGPTHKTALMGNCGHTLESADAEIGSGNAELISFGRSFMINPDLVERFENGWPLNETQDFATWFSNDVKGYNDFPTYSKM